MLLRFRDLLEVAKHWRAQQAVQNQLPVRPFLLTEFSGLKITSAWLAAQKGIEDFVLLLGWHISILTRETEVHISNDCCPAIIGTNLALSSSSNSQDPGRKIIMPLFVYQSLALSLVIKFLRSSDVNRLSLSPKSCMSVPISFAFHPCFVA